MFAKLQRVHFVGIGGIGMSGIAEVLLNLGYKVSGSDVKASAVTERLASLGASIFHGHLREHVAGADVVVASSAVPTENAELDEARRLEIPVIQRAEMLAELMRRKYGIAIAGMHGKTTTTSMIAAVLAGSGLDPTVVVGGRVDAMQSNARVGKSEYLVAEADESDRSFLKLSPILAVVTNIDREHMDCYRDMRDVKQAFLEFMNRVPFYGIVVACNDDPMLRALITQTNRRTVTYGVDPDSDFRARVIEKVRGFGGAHPISRFQVTYAGQDLGEFTLHVPGLHNVLNATAAIAVGIGLDIKPEQIRTALEKFRGVDRRFQLLGTSAGISVIDDYGHHPTEIRATLTAAKDCGFRKIHVIFQPHRYSRTQLLMDDFATAFDLADSLVVLDIYAASERPIAGITGRVLVARVDARRKGPKVPIQYATFGEAVGLVTELAHDGDMILTLGAGNVSHLGAEILQRLQAREPAPVVAPPEAVSP